MSDDKKISELAAGSDLTSTVFVGVQGGVNKKFSSTLLAEEVGADLYPVLQGYVDEAEDFAILAEAWAQSPTAPDVDDATSESAKTAADRAATEADAAENSADAAALAVIDAVAAAALSGSYDTLALANAALGSYVDGNAIQVTADGTNNGFYVRVAGAWVRKSTATISTLDVLVSDLLTTQDIGYSGTLASTTTSQDWTYVYNDTVDADGVLNSVILNVQSAGTVYLKRFTKSGDNFTQVDYDYPLVLSSTGEQTFTRADFGVIPLNAGEYLGIYANALIGRATTSSDANGYYNSGTGNNSAWTDTTPVTAGLIGFRFVAGSGRVAVLEASTEATEDTLANLDTPQIIGARGNLPSAFGLTGLTFVLNDQVDQDGFVRFIDAYVFATGTAYFKRFTKSGDVFTQVGPDYSLVLSATGDQRFSRTDFGLIPVEAGEYLGVYASGLIGFATAVDTLGGYYSSGAGNVASFTDATASTAQRLGFRFVLASGDIGQVVVDTQAATDTLATLFSGTESIGKPTTPTSGSTAASATYVLSDPATESGVLEEVRFYSAAAGTGVIRRFLKVGDVFTQTGSDYDLVVASGANTLSQSDFGLIPVNVGDRLGVYAPGLLTFTGGTSPTYYSASGNQFEFTDATPSSSNTLQLGFTISQGVFPEMQGAVAELQSGGTTSTTETVARPIVDAITDATISISGFEVAYTADLWFAGGTISAAGSTTSTAATAGYKRYDIVYFDLETQAFGVAAGTERTTDPESGIPTLSSKSYLPVYLLRTSDTTVTAGVPLWTVFDGVVSTVADTVVRDVARNRTLLRPFMNKIRRGSPIRILSVGDSITAMQNGTPSEAVPNGTARDRSTGEGGGAVYLANYGSDVLTTIPLYTAVQLGRADDGAGTVHTRVGYIWELITALEEIGYVLGTDLFYDNFCKGGVATDDFIDSTTHLPTAYLDAAVAYATSSSADLVIIALGMNEHGVSVGSDSDLMVKEFSDAGHLVLVMGTPRANGYTLSAYSDVCRRWRLAAEKYNYAYLSYQPIYLSDTIQAIGIAFSDVCASNSSNHPGLKEFEAIGRELVRLLME
jgi:hypothetical protein